MAQIYEFENFQKSKRRKDLENLVTIHGQITQETAVKISEPMMRIKSFVTPLLATDPVAVRRVKRYVPTVRKYTNIELIKWVEKTEESEWRLNPWFYCAVCDEMKKRLEAVFPSENGE